MMTRVEKIDLQTFNKLFKVKLKKNMNFIQVHSQLENITSFRCGIVAKDFDAAITKVLRHAGEYIINIEDTFYLCVKSNEWSV